MAFIRKSLRYPWMKDQYDSEDVEVAPESKVRGRLRYPTLERDLRAAETRSGEYGWMRDRFPPAAPMRAPEPREQPGWRRFGSHDDQ